MRLLAFFLSISFAANAQHRVVFPAGAKPIGPYSPGIVAGNYLYVSGQGGRDAAGKLPEGVLAQTRQCIENVKNIVENAHFSMKNIVYSQFYMADLTGLREAENLLPGGHPRAVVGVARMPGDTPVEWTVVVVKDPVKDRFYIPGVLAADTATAIQGTNARLKEVGLDLGHTVFLNVYLDPKISIAEMNAVYGKYFEGGNAPARATIQVAALPNGAHIQITGVAVRDLANRRVIRPRNMKASRTASPCVFASDTLFCSAKSGFIPGPNGGIYSDDVETQVRQSMRNLLDGLEEAGLDFSHVVATNVYVDQIDEFGRMNAVYGSYFPTNPPSRTTLQPALPVERKKGAMLEQISLIAVK